MPAVIQVPLVLRKIFNTEETEAAFVDILNRVAAEQRNGFQSALEMHLNAFKEYLDRRLVEAEAKNEKRFAEAEVKNEKRFAEADLKNEKRFGETNTNIAEAKAALQIQLAEYHRSLLRWMFAFFIGNLVTLLGFLLAYLQLVGKP
jgi:hypothetical protein